MVQAGVEQQIADSAWASYQHQFGGNAARAEQTADDVDFELAADAVGDRRALTPMDAARAALAVPRLGAAARVLRGQGERGLRRDPAPDRRQPVRRGGVRAGRRRLPARRRARRARPGRAAVRGRARRRPGRFAHGFRRELDAFVEALPFALPPIVYVMTDLGESTIEQWAANPALDDERFDFARFDVGGDGVLQLRRRGVALDRLANPLVVIANYVFDSIPADAFAISDGELQECLVTVEGADVASMQLAFSRGPGTDVRRPRPRRPARALPDDAGRHRGHAPARRDRVRAAAAGTGRRPPPAARGGQDPRHRGVARAPLGARAQRPRRQLLADGQLPRPRLVRRTPRRRRARTAATGTCPSTSSPSCSAPRRAVTPRPAWRTPTRSTASAPRTCPSSPKASSASPPQLSLAELVALLRLSGWDAFTLLGVAGQLREQAAEADPAAQDGLREALAKTYERHFPVPGEDDLPFTIGLILFELEDYEDAIDFFEASLEQHGPDEATLRNIDICESQLR